MTARLNPEDFGVASLVNAGDQQAINLIIGNMHVSTPDTEVVAEMRRRIKRSSMAGPSQYADAIVAYALTVHHDNADLYADVMGGRIG